MTSQHFIIEIETDQDVQPALRAALHSMGAAFTVQPVDQKRARLERRLADAVLAWAALLPAGRQSLWMRIDDARRALAAHIARPACAEQVENRDGGRAATSDRTIQDSRRVHNQGIGHVCGDPLPDRGRRS